MVRNMIDKLKDRGRLNRLREYQNKVSGGEGKKVSSRTGNEGVLKMKSQTLFRPGCAVQSRGWTQPPQGGPKRKSHKMISPNTEVNERDH